uniref:Uncharacterized protein n=1 Tax=Nelumbo nucifera TaxID=4432 RepID=A0A822ZBE6_NELNU|nr:TPA_asm: hypothetical protein HUJ06_000672 [Nelumbo nucifera]
MIWSEQDFQRQTYVGLNLDRGNQCKGNSVKRRV